MEWLHDELKTEKKNFISFFFLFQISNFQTNKISWMGCKEVFCTITTVYKHYIYAKAFTLAYSFLAPDDKSRVFHFGIAAIPAR